MMSFYEHVSMLEAPGCPDGHIQTLGADEDEKPDDFFCMPLDIHIHIYLSLIHI